MSQPIQETAHCCGRDYRRKPGATHGYVWLSCEICKQPLAYSSPSIPTMKSPATATLLADEAATAAVAASVPQHQPNDKGIYEQPEKIFVPVGVGNTCAFYLAHTPEGVRYGWDFWTRQPKNHSTQLPTVQNFRADTREEALGYLVASALTWFGDHPAIVVRIEAWNNQHLAAAPAAAAAGDITPAPAAEESAPTASAATSPAAEALASVETAPGAAPKARHDEIPLDAIGVGSNPRTERDPEKQRELVESLRTQPLLHPIVLRDLGTANPSPKPRYELIAGEGRLLAYRTLGRAEIEARIFTGVDRATALSWALVENLQRSDLNAMDEAEGYQQLATLGWTPDRMASETGKALRTIRAALILTKLPDEGRVAVRQGQLSAYQAREIAGRWRARPEHARVIIAAAIAEKIPGTELESDLPHRAIPALEEAKLLVRLPFGYADHPEVPNAAPFVRLGATTYCLEPDTWKQVKKAIDLRLREERTEAEKKAAAKVERAKESSASVPLADLRKAHVDVVRLTGDREIYAEHLPAEFVGTAIDESKAEVVVCLRPAELTRLESAWRVALDDDRTAVGNACYQRVMERLRKMKRIDARELAVLSTAFMQYGEPVRIDAELAKAVGVKLPKGDLEEDRAAWAKLAPVDQVKLLLVALLRAAAEVHDFPLYRWLLDTPKLGLIEEEPKRRDVELARLAAQLWPKEEAKQDAGKGYPAFRWNLNDVCENPEGYEVKLSAPAHCSVHFAQDNCDIWRANVNFGIKGASTGAFGNSGPVRLTGDGYGDHRFAILAELESALKGFAKSEHKAAAKAHRELQEHIAKFKAGLGTESKKSAGAKAKKGGRK